MNKNCTKCNTPPAAIHANNDRSPMARLKFVLTGFSCKNCGHLNDYRRRKGFDKYKEES